MKGVHVNVEELQVNPKLQVKADSNDVNDVIDNVPTVEANDNDTILDADNVAVNASENVSKNEDIEVEGFDDKNKTDDAGNKIDCG